MKKKAVQWSNTQSINCKDKLFFLSPENGIIKSDKVYEVMLATDRAHYSRCNPYMDSPQSIGMIIKPIMHRSTVSGVIIQPNVCFSFNLKAIKQPSALHTWYEIFHSVKFVNTCLAKLAFIQ